MNHQDPPLPWADPGGFEHFFCQSTLSFAPFVSESSLLPTPGHGNVFIYIYTSVIGKFIYTSVMVKSYLLLSLVVIYYMLLAQICTILSWEITKTIFHGQDIHRLQKSI